MNENKYLILPEPNEVIYSEGEFDLVGSAISVGDDLDPRVVAKAVELKTIISNKIECIEALSALTLSSSPMYLEMAKEAPAPKPFPKPTKTINIGVKNPTPARASAPRPDTQATSIRL